MPFRVHHVLATHPAANSPSANCRALLVALCVLWTPLSAKQLHAQKRGARVRVLSGSVLRTTPGGNVVGTLSRNLDTNVELEQGTSVRVRVTGFVSTSEVSVEGKLVRATVSAGDGATLRIGGAEKDAILARLRRGTVVFPSQKAGAFLAVERPVWVDKSRLAKSSATKATEAPPPVTKAPPAKAPIAAVTAPVPKLLVPPTPASTPKTSVLAAAPSASSAASVALRPLQTTVSTGIFAAPGGASVAGLRSGTLVSPLSTENGWTRVRIEGWVPSKDLAAASGHLADDVSAADLRAEPEANKGRVLHWDVEALSYQLADGLRRELEGAPYILALGPGKERAILYLAVPDSLVTAARGLSPLTMISVTAKVRTGRSQPGGVPILDLLELSRR